MPDPWRQRIAKRAALGIGALILALAILLVQYYHQRRTQIVVIAVLPFQADRTSGGIASVVTDSLAHQLARVRGFRILPTVRTADYRTSRDSAHAIAHTLGVRYLVIGRIDRAPLANAADRILVDSRLVDTEDSPPTIGQIIATTSTDLCPVVATIVHDIAAHFARAPHGPRWGPGGTTGCSVPVLFEESDDPGA
jgi:TolB-like protein